MKIALLGYGRMGKEIEAIALKKKHHIVLTIDIDNQDELTVENLKKADVAIDFSIPTSAYSNIMICFDAGIPVVSGTTGWLDKYDEVIERCKKESRTFFYASNYNIGVNIFFEINKTLARFMNAYPDYEVSMEEIHHIHKLDAPSGTAITIAEGILENLDRKSDWKLNKSGENVINISAIREGEIPGIHAVKYDSEVDNIEIKHSSKNRKGLALGAVLAAEYSIGKTGILTMQDLMNAK
jgi:4-hydroxy-tetrahydrodipicolinate reductase